jgi:DNA topoisomerase IA
MGDAGLRGEAGRGALRGRQPEITRWQNRSWCDPDREGEATGWHLAEELGPTNKKKIRRLMFNEITGKGVLAALDKPMDIDKKMVDAQQARRVLDRLGFSGLSNLKSLTSSLRRVILNPWHV